MPRPPIEQSVTFLYSDDLEAHAAFYRDVLELEQVLDQGVCRIFRVSGTSFLGVCNLPHRPRGTQGVMFTFLCEDVEAMYRDLLDKGVTFDGPPDMSGGRTVYSAFFHDPVGYMLEIQEFRDPDWPYPGGRKFRGQAD
ncbi:VOC family protein [Roseomonas sp. CCTCC AB2023176]|uniref:VOC family protein n=1 Tax=Roseomonas sp. CCTCC AB2023176 TaxID=3342640 RepID=UPI0035D92E4C